MLRYGWFSSGQHINPRYTGVNFRPRYILGVTLATPENISPSNVKARKKPASGMQPSPYGAGLAVNGDGAPAVMLEDDTESIEELPRISPLPSPDGQCLAHKICFFGFFFFSFFFSFLFRNALQQMRVVLSPFDFIFQDYANSQQCVKMSWNMTIAQPSNYLPRFSIFFFPSFFFIFADADNPSSCVGSRLSLSSGACACSNSAR